MAICMGDRNKILRVGETILIRSTGRIIREYMNILSNERWRISESKTCVMVNGEDIVPETMTGTISSLIAGSPKNCRKNCNFENQGQKKIQSSFHLENPLVVNQISI